MLLDIVPISNRYGSDDRSISSSLPHPVVDTSGVQFDPLDNIEQIGRELDLEDLGLSQLFKYKSIEIYGDLIVERLLLSEYPLNVMKLKSKQRLPKRLYCVGVKYIALHHGHRAEPYLCCPDVTDLCRMYHIDPVAVRSLMEAARIAKMHGGNLLSDELMLYVMRNRQNMLFVPADEEPKRLMFLDIWDNENAIRYYLNKMIKPGPRDPISKCFLDGAGTVEVIGDQLHPQYPQHIMHLYPKPMIELDDTWKLRTDDFESNSMMYPLIEQLYAMRPDTIVMEIKQNRLVTVKATSRYTDVDAENDLKCLFMRLKRWIHFYEKQEPRSESIVRVLLKKYWTEEVTIEIWRSGGTHEKFYVDIFFYNLGTRTI